MKRSLLLTFALVCVAGLAFAQAGSVGVFPGFGGASDPCNFVDNGGLVRVYIVHGFTAGATASQFMLDSPPAWTHLGDTWNFPTVIGTSVTGVSVAYGACLSNPIYLGVVNFFGASVPNCTYFGIVADPLAPSGLIEAVDCSEPPAKMFPTGGEGIVNDDATCGCGSPAEETTWGKVKAMYE